MSAIQDLFQQAELAEAAYANLWDTGLNRPITADDDLRAALKDASNKMTFSEAQADAFVKTWQVVDHIPDTKAGFSATIFRNKQTNAYHLAIRGSTMPLGSETFDFLSI